MKPYPPLLFGGGLLLALVGHLVAPLAMPGGWAALVVGVGLLGAAAVLAMSAEREMTRAHTPVLPFQDASALVTTGPFRRTRNPIYLAFTIAVVGIAGVTRSWWPLITLPLAIAAVSWVIRGEEARLGRLFGQEYAEYRSRTRRWL